MTDLSPLTFGRVIGRYLAGVADSNDVGLAPDVTPLSGTVTFTLSAPALRIVSAAPDPATLFPQSITAQLDSEGYISQNGTRGVSLLATDDPATNPTNLQWTASFSLWGPGGDGVTAASQPFLLPGGTEVDLTKVAPLETPAPNLIVTKGDKGDKGDPGIPGPSGPAGAGFEFTQSAPSASWVIPHSLGRRPVVAVFVNGAQVFADVTATTTSVSVAFVAPVTGVAVLT